MDFKENLLFGKYSNLNPIKPLLLWGNTNTELDNFYKKPEINIKNDKRMRNITRGDKP